MQHQLQHSLNHFFTHLRGFAAAFLAALFLVPGTASAAVLTPDLEAHLIKNVSTTWQTVTLANSYTDAIPICTYNLLSFSGTAGNYDYPPATVRIRNITASSFDVRIQGWEDGPAFANNVHCIVTDKGSHTLPDGRKYEAYTVLSDKTAGRYSTDGGWLEANMENVSATITNTYKDPVVLGQVISYNDNRASVFHATHCETRQGDPFLSGMADGICVGKHVGQIPAARNSETIGYLVAEAGSGTVNGIDYLLGSGKDAVAGNNGANSGSAYSISGDYTVGVLSQQGEDGGDGSWAVLYGADPLPNNEIKLAVDEETVVRDQSRNHTTEPVDYWLFATAELTLKKLVINDNGGTAVATDFTLLASGPENISGVHGDSSITEVAVPPGTYTLSESGPAGYQGKWDCVGGKFSGVTVLAKPGIEIVCTLVNDDIKVVPVTASLTLQKNVTNDDGGQALSTDFTLSFDNGSTHTGTGVQGDPAITSAVVTAGNYILSETSVAGYLLSGIKCSGKDSNGTDGLSIDPGEVVTCVFINDDQGVDLAVDKTVSDASPNVGDTITFSIAVTNNGPGQATNFHITDVVKPGFSYVVGSMTGADVRLDASPTGTGLDWEIYNLASGATTVLTFQATVSSP